MKRLVLESPAKLNLYLKVLGKRTDGFHEIETVFERISLFDQICLVLNSTGSIRIRCLTEGVPEGRDNLAYRAASVLKKDFSVKDGVQIFITKHIPVGSGLGGGSSNAAATLLGLNRLWGLNLTRTQLLKYARSLGSDVPFFVLGHRFALGKGRGDQIEALRGLSRFWHLVVVPERYVSTRKIYQGLDLKLSPEPAKRSEAEELTNNSNNVRMFVHALKNKDFVYLSRNTYNTLETVTIEQCPIVAKIKHYLKDLGIDTVGMSGSGAAVFAILKTRKEALKFKSHITQVKDWQTFVVNTF